MSPTRRSITDVPHNSLFRRWDDTQTEEGKLWGNTSYKKTILEKPTTVGSMFTDVKRHSENNDGKYNNSNVTTVQLLLNSKTQKRTVVKNAVSRGRTLISYPSCVGLR